MSAHAHQPTHPPTRASKYYVMLLPNKRYMVLRPGDKVRRAEFTAIDCWIVWAENKEHALGVVLHKLYNALKPTTPSGIRRVPIVSSAQS